MKKIGLLSREKIVEEIKQKVQNAQGCFFIGYGKIEAFAINTTRNDLQRIGARVFTARNSLFEKAFSSLGNTDLDGFFDGETSIVLVQKGDLAEVCKLLVDLAKENENFKIKGGILKDKKITPADLAAIAKLPSREVILAMALRGMASPLTGFLGVMNQVILKFVWAIEEIKKKKS